MAGQDILMATSEELRKLHIIRKALEGSISQTEAAEYLELSVRQVSRLQIRVKEEGDKGILHRSRGSRSHNAFGEEVYNLVISLYRQKYYDFGPTLFSEKLYEDEGVTISDETARQWLIRAGLWQRARKKVKHYQRRQRRWQFGQLVQIDGSHHKWLEDRGPKSVLMAYIDDATSRIYGRFYEYEGTIPAMDSFLRYIRKNGLPLSVYVDKHTTYKSPGRRDYYFDDEETLSQFERAMKELGVQVIHAHSPQAKGRVERLFGTLQDRLVKELRLANISSIEEANIFLQGYLAKHNRRFAVKAAQAGDMHRKTTEGLDLKRILCNKTERVVKNDYTVSYKGKLYQIMEAFEQSTVMVEERLNGKMEIMLGDRALSYVEIKERPEKEQKSTRLIRKRPSIAMPADHPYKKTRELMLKGNRLKKQHKQPAPWALQ
jgi:hypothetical protein